MVSGVDSCLVLMEQQNKHPDKQPSGNLSVRDIPIALHVQGLSNLDDGSDVHYLQLAGNLHI